MPPPPDRDAGPRESPPDLRAWFGGIDIYLFDQVLKGRFHPGMRILDAGCGTGRNLNWFLRSGYDVHAVDEDEEGSPGLADLPPEELVAEVERYLRDHPGGSRS